MHWKTFRAFRGANHPPRRTDHTYEMDLQGFIETEDGATVMLDFKGYGRAYPKGRRHVVGAAWHICDDERYRWLNDSISVISGEVRAPSKPPEEIVRGDIELVCDVSELVWGPRKLTKNRDRLASRRIKNKEVVRWL